MDQNAFRNLLNSAATTRPPPRESGVDGGAAGNGNGGGGGKSKTWKPRPKPVKDGISSNSSSLGTKNNESSKFQFRDRADERRKGLHAEEDEAEEALYKSLGVEESKFLGGDLAHTHLVKGLDFALLAKMRREAGSTSTVTNTTTTAKGGVTGVQATASSVHASSSSSLTGTSRVTKSRNSNEESQSSSSSSSSSLFAKSILEAVAASLQLQQQQQQQQHLSSSTSLAVSSTTQYAHLRFLPGRTTFSYSCAANAAADCALLFANAEEADSLPTIATRETTYSERKTLVIDRPNAEIEDRILEALFKHRVIKSGRRKRITTMAQQDSLPLVAVNDNDSTHQSDKIKVKKDNFINKVKEEEEEEEDIFSGIGTYSTVVASTTVTTATKTAETIQHSKEAPIINTSTATLNDKSSMLISSSTFYSSSTTGSVVSESTRPSRFSATASAAATTVSSSSRVTEFEKDETNEKKPALPPVSSHNVSAPHTHQHKTQSMPARFCDPLLRATLDHGLGGLEGFDEWDELEHSGKHKESLVELRRKADEKKQFHLIHGGGGGHSTSSSALSQKNPRSSVTSQPKVGLGSVLNNRNINEDEEDGLIYGNSSRKRQHEYAKELIDEEEEEEEKREKVEMEEDDGDGKQVSDKEVAPRTEDDLLDEQFERHKPLINSSSSTHPLSLSTTSLTRGANHIDADILALRSGSFSMLGGAREEAMAAVIAAKAATRNAKAEAMIGGRKQQFVPPTVSAASKASASTSSSSSSWRPGSWNNDEGNDDDDDDGDGSDGGGGGGKGGTNNNKRARIDTELSQINRILEDRKSSGGGGGKIPTQPSLKHKKGKGSTYDED